MQGARFGAHPARKADLEAVPEDWSNALVVGRAVVDAVRDAGNRWIFRDLGLEPWNGVKYVLAANPEPVLKSMAEAVGQRFGGGLATSFELLRL